MGAYLQLDLGNEVHGVWRETESRESARWLMAGNLGGNKWREEEEANQITSTDGSFTTNTHRSALSFQLGQC